MEQKMFCYQCEQTMCGTGCTGMAGVCGKKFATAGLQDKLTGTLIALAGQFAGKDVPEKVATVLMEGLFTTITNVNFNDATLAEQIAKTGAAAQGTLAAYDMKKLWQHQDEDIRSLKSLILFGLRGMAAYAYHAKMLGYSDQEVNNFFAEGLAAVGADLAMPELLSMVLKVGEINLKCMALLDKANTESYGNPVPTTVSLTVEKGPFIVVTGHDLKDLELLLHLFHCGTQPGLGHI